MNTYREKLLFEIGIIKDENELKFQDWFEITGHAELSDAFLIEFQDYIFWTHYFNEKSVKYSIIKSFILKTNISNLSHFKTDHLTNNQKEDIRKLLDLKYLFKK